MRPKTVTRRYAADVLDPDAGAYVVVQTEEDPAAYRWTYAIDGEVTDTSAEVYPSIAAALLGAAEDWEGGRSGDEPAASSLSRRLRSSVSLRSGGEL